MKPDKRAILLTLAQAVLVLALILTIIPAALPTVMLVSLMQNASQVTQGIEMDSILLCLRDLALGICLVCAEMEGLSILSRMKKAPAATEKNDASLKRIIIALVIAAAIALLFGDAIVPYLFTMLPAVPPLVERLLAPALLLCAALAVRTVKKKLQAS